MDQGNGTGSPAAEKVTPASEDASPKMDLKIKVDWLNALRSGEYLQTRRRLRSGGGFCCLGVLCDISSLGDWVPLGYETGQKFKVTLGDEIDYGIAHMPSLLSGRLGLNDDQLNTLMEMNDDGGKSFAEIADFIEANL